MPAPLPHPNIEPPPGAHLDSAALAAILAEIQRNFDALSLSVPDRQPRQIAGRISSAGAILSGSGFTVTHTTAGIYLLTFTTAFPAPPVVMATPFAIEAAESCQASSTATGTTVLTLNPAGEAASAGFNVWVRQA